MNYENVAALKELSYTTYGRPREEVEEEIRIKFDASYGKKPAAEAPSTPLYQ